MGERSLWEREAGSSILPIPTTMKIHEDLKACSDLVDELDAALASAEKAVTVTDLKELAERQVALASRVVID